jgi:malonate-semialdehyde dehydrogenase (acetylating)/methylmalonate-semialdehyde dehydrogenase
MENTAQVISESAFGCAGQRCLAASLAITVGEAGQPFAEAIEQRARERVTGYGLEEGVQMGPVITAESRNRIEGLVGKALTNGARALVDGRGTRIPNYSNGNFVRPTVLDGVPLTNELTRTEIFGPVLSMHRVETIDQALEVVNTGDYGNMACVFTSSGASARRFRYEAEVGNVGINVGVAAPMAFFPFSGARGSFYGDLHGQGRDAFAFFTKEKVVVERWRSTLSRKF